MAANNVWYRVLTSPTNSRWFQRWSPTHPGAALCTVVPLLGSHNGLPAKRWPPFASSWPSQWKYRKSGCKVVNNRVPLNLAVHKEGGGSTKFSEFQSRALRKWARRRGSGRAGGTAYRYRYGMACHAICAAWHEYGHVWYGTIYGTRSWRFRFLGIVTTNYCGHAPIAI